jgi:nitrate reductase NapAB chaperone NapD
MNKIRIAHEAPKSIFKEVEEVTDYSYALVHLFVEDPEYLALFKQAKEDGREIILDNSIFELEEAFDAEKFAGWVLELRPDWYIVPDALEDAKKTCSQMAEWNMRYKDLPGKKIGVVQGKTYEQIKSCYEYMDKIANVDMIAISFDYSYYTESFPHPNKLVSWAMGRAKLLGDLLRDGIINTNKKHHLLGCSLPQEFSLYSQYDWIYSLDTSNPVVHGIKGIEYREDGLWSKESQKLFELINHKVKDTNIILYNINKFKWFVNGSKV